MLKKTKLVTAQISLNLQNTSSKQFQLIFANESLNWYLY